MLISGRTILPLLMTLAAALSPGLASAQTYPGKPIRFVLPFPPGGGTDGIARIVGDTLSKRLGQRIWSTIALEPAATLLPPSSRKQRQTGTRC